jgi:hypothetical protein
MNTHSSNTLMRSADVRIRYYRDDQGELVFVAEHATGPMTNTPAFPPPTADECIRLCPIGFALYHAGLGYKAKQWEGFQSCLMKRTA